MPSCGYQRNTLIPHSSNLAGAQGNLQGVDAYLTCQTMKFAAVNTNHFAWHMVNVLPPSLWTSVDSAHPTQLQHPQRERGYSPTSRYATSSLLQHQCIYAQEQPLMQVISGIAL